MAHRGRRLTLALAAWFAAVTPAWSQPVLGEAVKVGEVGSDRAVVWCRLARSDTFDHEAFRSEGTPGEARVRVAPAGMSEWTRSGWVRADAESDFVVEIPLEGLVSAREYRFEIEARSESEGPGVMIGGGTFATAPAPLQARVVRFTVTTGHRFESREREGGQEIYGSMLGLRPHFMVHTGDVLYYDRGNVVARDVGDARAKWHRLYSLPAHREFHARVPVYFMKDDHDLLKDDCWPGQTYGDLTFGQGQSLFLEQTPISGPTHRTFRWGRDLQVWLMEGRDHRSPNREPDGPDKTIWGEEQWAWLERTVAASDATFRVLVSPTPIVGPDRDAKNDNHSNAGFAFEGERVRRFVAAHGMLVFCGDRHWQYVSVDADSGVTEYSCGPSTDAHSGGWRADDLRPEHRFLRVAGGFLSCEVEPLDGSARLTVRLHATDGTEVHREERVAGVR